jgi:hypothetical protein
MRLDAIQRRGSNVRFGSMLLKKSEPDLDGAADL